MFLHMYESDTNKVLYMSVKTVNCSFSYKKMNVLFTTTIIILFCIHRIETKPRPFGDMFLDSPQTLNIFTSSIKIIRKSSASQPINQIYHRYHYFVGDDGIIEIIDDEDFVDNDFLLSFLQDPHNSTFLLYTRYNPYIPQILYVGQSKSILHSNFDYRKITVFLVHGWKGHGYNRMTKLLTSAFLNDGDVNVIVVDWSTIAANYNYNTAKAGTAAVGKHLGIFINYLVENGFTMYRQIHLIGFSLGAHLAGCAGKATGGAISRITALDPAGPNWYDDRDRLMSTDAQYVEVIHTNTKLFGIWEGWGLGYSYPCGDVDFYPNGGGTMVGCYKTNICSHISAYKYMASSVENNHFVGRECNSFSELDNNECKGAVYPMGNSDIYKYGRGVYRVNTVSNYPY